MIHDAIEDQKLDAMTALLRAREEAARKCRYHLVRVSKYRYMVIRNHGPIELSRHTSCRTYAVVDGLRSVRRPDAEDAIDRLNRGEVDESYYES